MTRLPAKCARSGRTAYSGALYRALQQSDPKSHDVEEGTLTGLGITSWRDGRLPDAITAFRMSVVLYPDSMNAHDTLGSLYAAANEKAKAVAEYEESARAPRVALGPDHGCMGIFSVASRNRRLRG